MNWPDPWRPIIVAHRGGVLGQTFAENSAEAFAASINDGFINECDVQASCDGEAIIIHDETLDRTTVATGRVVERTADELCRIALQTSDGSLATIPLLKDVVASVSLVEVKPPDAAQLVRRVLELMVGRDWTLLSFDQANLIHAKKIDSSIRVALVVDDLGGAEAAIDQGWEIQINHKLLDDRIVARARDKGLIVGTWTVNLEASLIRVASFRPDLITSDAPRRLRQSLRKRGISV